MMDLDTIGTVLLNLFTVPLIMLLWIGVFYLFGVSDK